MSLLLTAISPVDLGLPAKYQAFRTAQAEAIDWIAQSDAQFLAASAATGTGKSLLGVAAAKILGARAVYLTSTRGLEDQIVTDFSPIGLKDVRGRANYRCSVYTGKFKRPTTCEQGMDEACSLATTTGCPYALAVQKANLSDLVATNYSYWLHARRSNENALSVEKPVDILICDEAHSIFEELARFLAVHFSRDELEFYARNRRFALGESGLVDSDGWRDWAVRAQKQAAQLLNQLKEKHGSVAAAKEEEPGTYEELENFRRKALAVSSMDDNWVWESTDYGVSFDVIWPGRYASMLWEGVPRVLFLSATLRPYMLHLVGLKKGDYEYQVFDNGWPANHAPVYYWPIAKLNYRSSDDDYREVARAIDQIIESRSDRKGIIQTVSYARARTLLRFSRHAHKMFANDSSRDSTETARKFRNAKPPAVLISPSYQTGWDFAYDQCEYQILVKVPWANSESRVVQERLKNESYRISTAAFEIVQIIGRARRAHDDRSETFILDKTFPLILVKGRQYLPHTFNAHRIARLPNPPKKL